MRLKVLRRDEAVRYSDCQPPVAVATIQHLVPLQEGKTLDCPDIQEAASMSNSTPTVTWYYSGSQTAVNHLWTQWSTWSNMVIHMVQYGSPHGST